MKLTPLKVFVFLSILLIPDISKAASCEDESCKLVIAEIKGSIADRFRSDLPVTFTSKRPEGLTCEIIPPMIYEAAIPIDNVFYRYKSDAQNCFNERTINRVKEMADKHRQILANLPQPTIPPAEETATDNTVQDVELVDEAQQTTQNESTPSEY